MMKPDSLYNHGLRPLMYSEKGARIWQVLNTVKHDEEVPKKWGWKRCGENVC